MDENRVTRASKNIIWSGLNTIVGMLLPFATQTCLVYILGVEYVGLNGLFTSILDVLNLTELGIGSAIVYSMYKPIAIGDNKKIGALLALYKKCYRIVGFLVLVIGLFLMPLIPHLVSDEIPKEINIYVLYGAYLLNTVISYFMFAYKASILNALQKVDVISIVSMIVTIIKAVLQCGALILVKEYYLFVCALPITTILQNVIIGILVSSKYPQYKSYGTLTSEEIGALKKKIYGLISQKIGGVVVFSVDNIVVSAFLGITTLGMYSNYMFIFKAIKRILDAVQTSIIPVIGNSIAIESLKKNYNNFKSLLILYLWLISWMAICQLCLYQPFISIWVGEDCLFDDITMMLFVLYFYTIVAGELVYVYTQAAGIWWEGRYITIINAIVNLIINIILVQFIGLRGVLISTIVSILVILIPWRAKVLFSKYFNFTNAYQKYISSQISHFVVTVLIGGVTYCLCSIVELTGILNLIVRAFICCVVPNIAFYLFYCNHSDFVGCKDILKKILKMN